MNTLFDLKLLERPDLPQGETCRHCMHKYRHQYNNNLYCGKQLQRRTSYGHKKIKAGDQACWMFEKIIK
jgi:hypothetical protein